MWLYNRVQQASGMHIMPILIAWANLPGSRDLVHPNREGAGGSTLYHYHSPTMPAWTQLHVRIAAMHPSLSSLKGQLCLLGKDGL